MLLIGDDALDRYVIGDEPAGSIKPERPSLLLQAVIGGLRPVPPPGPRRHIGHVPLTMHQSGALAHPCEIRCSSHRTPSFLSTIRSTRQMRSMHGVLCGPLRPAKTGPSSPLEQ